MNERLEERERGLKAKAILENPLWNEAWTQIESYLMEQWRNSRPDAATRRENIYLQYDAARAVRKHFESLLETGRMAEMQIEQENQRVRDGTGSTT